MTFHFTYSSVQRLSLCEPEDRVNRPLYDAISTVGLSVGVGERWRRSADKTISFRLDCVTVLDSSGHRAAGEGKTTTQLVVTVTTLNVTTEIYI